MRRAFSVSVFARDPRGHILVIHHNRLGTWLPVGGEVEPQETPLEAAARELREETGLSGRFVTAPVCGLAAVDGAPPALLAYEEHPAGDKGLHMNFCFVADVDGVPRGDGSYSEHRFVTSMDGLPCPDNVRQLVALLVDDPAAMARRWLAAFNARDLDGLLALYADDAAHTSPKLRDRRPETGGRVVGKAALRAWWQDAFDRLPGLFYRERAVTAGPSRVVLEYVREVPGEAPLVVAELFVVRAGRIVESHVFHG
jgi:8-oxo-dGTP pyrophosphatase MutT (NUDIX family)